MYRQRRFGLFPFRLTGFTRWRRREVQFSVDPGLTEIGLLEGQGLRVVSLPSGHVISVLPFAAPPEDLEFSPDGRMLLASGGGSIELRRVTDGSVVRKITGLPPGSTTTGLRLSPDGTLLAGVIMDHRDQKQPGYSCRASSIRVWRIDSQAEKAASHWPALINAVRGATAGCLSIEDRKTLLIESQKEAQDGVALCVANRQRN
jgi:hypothetical protein